MTQQIKALAVKPNCLSLMARSLDGYAVKMAEHTSLRGPRPLMIERPFQPWLPCVDIREMKLNLLMPILF